MRTLVWYRGKELRIADHAPLASAAKSGEVVCAFVVDPYFFAPERARELPHRIQFLLESIAALGKNLEARGSRLLLVSGKAVETVPELARTLRVDRVVSQRWTEPFGRERDDRIEKALDVPFELFDGETLATPGSVLTKEGGAYSVFTPFSRAHRAVTRIEAPTRAPAKVPPLPADVRVKETKLPELEALGIARNPDLLAGGEAAARARLARFVAHAAATYDDGRNRMDLDGTSRLSVDLKFGTLSPRTVWTHVEDALARSHPAAWKAYANELLWREFTYDLLWHRPRLLREPFRPEWKNFPWEHAKAHWRAWVLGQTGYPVVDASARQLLGEGFVHNRARMISASFLVKDLRIDYRRGEAHYMKYLTDGDWAANNAGWQWTAGCGCDAAPYFRVFNPMDQGKRFDPTGGYVRRWVPEIAQLPDDVIHAPWTASPNVLRAAGVVLGKTYPPPIVDHAGARTRFLAQAGALRPRG